MLKPASQTSLQRITKEGRREGRLEQPSGQNWDGLLAKAHVLTAVFVRQIKNPGVYRDGDGLILRAFPTGAKRWVFRATAQGRPRDTGLGSAHEVSPGSP